MSTSDKEQTPRTLVTPHDAWNVCLLLVVDVLLDVGQPLLSVFRIERCCTPQRRSHELALVFLALCVGQVEPFLVLFRDN
jgi:hypothetical protein